MKPVLTVPQTAVATRNGRQVVYQVKENKAVEVPVTVGAQMGSLVEIKEGLRSGDKVIASVDEKIEPGNRVTLQTT